MLTSALLPLGSGVEGAVIEVGGGVFALCALADDNDVPSSAAIINNNGKWVINSFMFISGAI
jgi:hypothetical protein